MNLIDKLTELVAGKALMEKASKKAFEKRHKNRGTEEHLRQFTTVNPEPAPVDAKTHLRSRQQLVKLPQKASAQFEGALQLRDGRPLLDRNVSESAAQEKPEIVQRSLAGPPDLTAADLTPEEFRRAYSTDNAWNKDIQKLPPLFPCHGFGKYRMSKFADTEWKAARLQQLLRDLTPALVDKVFELGLSDTAPEAWRRCASEYNVRGADSWSSTASGASQTKHEEYVDLETGIRISRGFVPSFSSSRTSSFNTVSNTQRRNSAQSAASSSTDGGLPFGPLSPRRSIINRRLDTIKESNTPSPFLQRKIEKPCEFHSSGDPDSAVASDEDSEDDDGWTDLHEGPPFKPQQFILSKPPYGHARRQSLHRQAVSTAALYRARSRSEDLTKDKVIPRTGIDRNKTLRSSKPLYRPAVARRISTGGRKELDDMTAQGKPRQIIDSHTVAAASTQKATKCRPCKVRDKSIEQSACSAGSSDDSSDSVVWMIGSAGPESTSAGVAEAANNLQLQKPKDGITSPPMPSVRMPNSGCRPRSEEVFRINNPSQLTLVGAQK